LLLVRAPLKTVPRHLLNLLEQRQPEFCCRRLSVANDAQIGDLRLIRGPWPRDGLIEDSSLYGVVVRRALQLRHLLPPHQIGCERQHHRCFVLSAVNFVYHCLRVDFSPCGWVEHANMRPKVGWGFWRQRSEAPTIPAVTVDNGKVACGQAADDLASEIPDECSHALN